MTRYAIRASTTASKAAQQLRMTAIEAGNQVGNAAGRSGLAVLTNYLDWAHQAELLLGNHFDADQVAELIHTSHYATLSTCHGTEPRIIRLVLDELTRRQNALDALAEELDALDKPPSTQPLADVPDALSGGRADAIPGRPKSPYTAHVVEVLIASPGDVLEERQALREAIWGWNDEHASDRKVVLLPVGWETHSRPELGAHPQALIDRQVAERAQVLIGVFWTRLGTPTPTAASGTVHEIQQFKDAGKPVMLYFSDKPAPPSIVEPGQLEAVKAFRKTAQEWGLLGSFDSVNGLVQQARTALLRLVRERFDLPTTATPARAGSGTPRLVAEPVRESRGKIDSKGRHRETTHRFLQVTNVGDAPARAIQLSWADGAAAGPRLHDAEHGISDLPGGTSVRFSALVHSGTPLSARLRMTWKDDAGDEYTEHQTIKF